MDIDLPKSLQDIPDEVRDYLSFAVKAHAIASNQLLLAFNKVVEIPVKRVLRARIFSEYGMALEDLFAITFAISQAYRKEKYKDFRTAIYGYGARDIEKLIKEHDFTEKDLYQGLSFPDISIIKTRLPQNDNIEEIYTQISYVLREMKTEYPKILPIVNKLKHAFLVVNKPPKYIVKQLGYNGDEVFVRTQQSGYTTNNIIEALSLKHDLVKHEVNNIKIIENTLTSLLNIFLASFNKS
jgi:hypothetical protein